MKIIIGIILSIAIIGCLCTPDIIAPKMSPYQHDHTTLHV